LREVTIFPWGTSYAFKPGTLAGPADAREVEISPLPHASIVLFGCLPQPRQFALSEP